MAQGIHTELTFERAIEEALLQNGGYTKGYSEDFDAQNYISMDKQILRDFGKADNWKEKAKTLKSGEKLEVNVPSEIKDKILSGYTTILNRLSK